MALSTEIFADSPEIYYQFRDVGNTTAVDASGNGHTLTLHNTPTMQQASLHGEAGDFSMLLDDAQSECGFIDTPLALQGLAAITLEWLGVFDNPSATSDVCIFHQQAGANYNAAFSGQAIGINQSGQLYAYASQGSGGLRAEVIHSVDLRDGLPHHLVMKTDGLNVYFWVDGVLSGTAPMTGGLFNAVGRLWVGGSSNSTFWPAPFSNFHSGTVCEAAVYTSALADSRILVHATEAGFTPPATATILPLLLRSVIARGAASIPLHLKKITTIGAASVPLTLRTPDPAHYRGSAARWSAQVALGGVDVSAQLTGILSIEHSENASGLADFTLIPPAGPLDPADYENKPVWITFVGQDAGASTLYTSRRFTGKTTAATFDPDAGTLRVECSTDLQGQLEQLPRAGIDAIVGGLWSEHIFDDQADGWQYAQDRLSTLSAELHVDNYGALAVVPWAIGAPVVTFSDAHRFADTLTLERASRRDLITQVEVRLDFRYVRLRHREINVALINSLGLCGWLAGEGQLPSKARVLSAADGGQWTRTSEMLFTDLPATALANICGGTNYAPNEITPDLCLGASWTAARRWAQTVNESYTLTVENSDLEAANGAQVTNADYGVEAVFDGSDFERIQAFDGPPAGAIESSATGDWQLEATDAERTGRAAFGQAVACALAVAANKIKRAARGNQITFEPLYDPAITLANTVAVNTPSLSATGKVAELRESLDLAAGDPQMRLTLSISRHGGPGGAADDPLTAPAAPAQPAEAVTDRAYYIQYRSGGTIGAPADNPDWDGWITNAFGAAQTDPNNLYRERLVLRMPEIEAGARDAQELIQAASYSVAVPQDPLTMSN